MSQQSGIVVVVDVEAAIQAGALEGNIYFFDNMGPFGTTGQGTDTFVSAVNGTHWPDGSQAGEQVVNFVVVGVTSLPTSLFRGYGQHRQRQMELATLATAHSLVAPAGGAVPSNAETRTALAGIQKPLAGSIKQLSGHVSERVLLDHFGRLVPTGTKADSSSVAQLPPIITGITGEAVEKGIIYPAQYGSPDLVNGGWYWSATVATHSPKVWSYTLHILLHRLVSDEAGEFPFWEPVPLTCDANLNISNRPMRNGFTGGGTGLLPVGVAC
jgi:hypothetical protein